MFELMDAYSQSAVIKVIGVGGGGGNAVSHMVASGIEGVDFICVNTDAQALKASKVKTALQIGSNITKGLGAGADPEIGRQAAVEDRDRIIELINGCDMLFITAGMGGGTGTGAAPVVAQIARELGILTVAVVTRPFNMEGNKRSLVADHGISELTKNVDSLITIPNQKLLTVLGPTTTLLDAFKSANQVLQGAVQGIAELITRPGLINVDFADVRTVMSETGMAMMGSGVASGEGRARAAAWENRPISWMPSTYRPKALTRSSVHSSSIRSSTARRVWLPTVNRYPIGSERPLKVSVRPIVPLWQISATPRSGGSPTTWSGSSAQRSKKLTMP
ncbi:MAG: cell division protein FtsZ [Proteobacteria bacterium]|nr:cell division protein FtsZ [Pseudomonadota bacterium]